LGLIEGTTEGVSIAEGVSLIVRVGVSRPELETEPETDSVEGFVIDASPDLEEPGVYDSNGVLVIVERIVLEFVELTLLEADSDDNLEGELVTDTDRLITDDNEFVEDIDGDLVSCDDLLCVVETV